MSGWCQKSSKPSLVTPKIPEQLKPNFHFNNVISANLVHFNCFCFAYYLPLDNGNSLWLSILPQLALTFCPQLPVLAVPAGLFAPKGL